MEISDGKNMIALGVVGSKAYGTDNVDSDTDIMGVYIESREYVTGIFSSDRGTSARTYEAGTRAKAGDTDGATYPLRHFARLAINGNPNITPFMYLPTYETAEEPWLDIVSNRDLFLSRKMGRNALGYMRSQRDAMLGMRNKKTNRPELVHKYGFDTKFAYHMVRVGMMGLELMRDHTLTLPLVKSDALNLKSIRGGLASKGGVLKLAQQVEDDLLLAIDKTSLPEEADTYAVNALLHEIYIDDWRKE